LGILLYLLGWVTKAEVLAAWIRKGGGVLFVFGATLLVGTQTRISEPRCIAFGGLRGDDALEARMCI